MKKMICSFAVVLATLTFSPVFGAELDTKALIGTFVFKSKKVNEEKAIKIGESLSTDQQVQRILVRQFKDADTWAVDIELKHDGTKESFQKAVSKIENSIEEKFGKDLVQNKYVASSVTWIKK
jgi:hypothetical protein